MRTSFQSWRHARNKSFRKEANTIHYLLAIWLLLKHNNRLDNSRLSKVDQIWHLPEYPKLIKKIITYNSNNTTLRWKTLGTLLRPFSSRVSERHRMRKSQIGYLFSKHRINKMMKVWAITEIKTVLSDKVTQARLNAQSRKMTVMAKSCQSAKAPPSRCLN